MVLNALHIHQSGGMDEAHFGIFVMLQQLAYGVRCFTRPGWDVVFIRAGTSCWRAPCRASWPCA